jgi:RNA-directed DNA polymerase
LRLSLDLEEPQDDARRFYRELPFRLGKFGLTLEPAKTRLMRFGRCSRANHAVLGTKQQVASFLGFTLIPRKGRDNKFALTLQTQKERLRRFIQNCKMLLRQILHLPLSDQAVQISARLRGHFNYFGVSGNTRALRGVHNQVTRYWRKCLSRRSQTGEVNWLTMRRILKRNPLPKAQIRIPYSKFGTFARM